MTNMEHLQHNLNIGIAVVLDRHIAVSSVSGEPVPELFLPSEGGDLRTFIAFTEGLECSVTRAEAKDLLTRGATYGVRGL